MDAARDHSLGEIPLLGEIKLEKNQHSGVTGYQPLVDPSFCSPLTRDRHLAAAASA